MLLWLSPSCTQTTSPMAYLILISLFLWIPKTLPVKANESYNKDWVLFQGVRYKISPGTLAWSQADEFCRKIGGDLLQIQSRGARMFLEKTSKETCETRQTWWVGRYFRGRFERSSEPVSHGKYSQLSGAEHGWSRSLTVSTVSCLGQNMVDAVLSLHAVVFTEFLNC